MGIAFEIKAQGGGVWWTVVTSGSAESDMEQIVSPGSGQLLLIKGKNLKQSSTFAPVRFDPRPTDSRKFLHNSLVMAVRWVFRPTVM